MNRYEVWTESLTGSEAQARLAVLYGSRGDVLRRQTARYQALLARHEQDFGAEKAPVRLISAPGRTEIGGNHTDHNRGKVLAAAVNLDTLAAVSPRKDMLVHLHSAGYRPITVDLKDLEASRSEFGTTRALLRGVACRMKQMGCRIGGFDACVTSTVASGSGLSSSAAFEVMVTAIQDKLYNSGDMDFKSRAKVSQYAENVHFGKPSGLLDQMASAAGGLVTVDFREDDPEVSPLSYDFAAKGYAIVVVGTGGSHADLTDYYASIPAEMKRVAAFFGQDVLRRVPEAQFTDALPSLYGKVPDRAILRALHFYQENARVQAQVAALREDRLEDFFREIIASGRSSFMYLQNVYARPTE
ncbi:MAG: galactokinase, partial [Lachnospiraceae bacterium]|nr:galactokinase [Lachnospiraceae bacterium]